MSVRNLQHLFRPESVAVFGASNRPQSVGRTVMRNLLEAGFPGPILPVNPHHSSVAGVLAYPDAAALPVVPDLAVVCAPPSVVPEIIRDVGARGTRAAVVMTAGLRDSAGSDGRSLRTELLEAARPHLLRVLGPNCVGLLVPGIGLNASFAPTSSLPGSIAFVSQSGALCTSVLDWARPRGIGFSHFVSLGDCADIDFGDTLDYLASDPETRAILLYVEAITGARKFLSAGRAAARNKPVIVVKAGRRAAGARAASSHTGALAGSDEVYDAAIRRAGMLRVRSIRDLFGAVETLSTTPRPRGERIAVVTNGGGPGVLAADAIADRGGRLAELSATTMQALDAALPSIWSRGNPIDLIGDAPVARYAAALRTVLDDPGVDAVLLIHSPTAIVPAARIAEAVVPICRETHKPVLTSWIGDGSVDAARRVVRSAGLPAYDTPEHAVRAFWQLIDYRHNQSILLETPRLAAVEIPTEAVTSVAERLASGVRGGSRVLDEVEAKRVLSDYGIEVVRTKVASDADEAVALAHEIGHPVAVKVLHPEITHKSDVGGVALDLVDDAGVRAAVERIRESVASRSIDVSRLRYTVQPMVRRPGAHELIVGASTDPVFGPVILFGHGGTEVEIVADRAIALPPLNEAIVRDLIGRTRIARLLDGYRNRPGVDRAALVSTILRVGRLVTDHPEIVELDLNPVLADERGVIVLDARIGVAPPTTRDRLAIRRYPTELEEWIDLPSGRFLVRPIRPEDEAAHQRLFERLSPADIHFRFFRTIRDLPHTEMARYTQIDYDREMAFIATRVDPAGNSETIGVVRAVTDPDNDEAEFGIIVASDEKHRGLGRILMEKMIRYCRGRGTRALVGEVLPDNSAMLSLARKLGFEVHHDGTEETCRVRLAL
ncbi:MAG: GNAT family N-acetyltransferase [Planctomycetes bacterium]|nr:GNAT family N-acetyltransferase [Planctomycetota bacterium]